MPAEVTVEIRGLEKLTELARKYPKAAQKHIDAAIVRSIGEIDIKNKPLTPVKSGRLRNSFIPIFRPFIGTYGSPVPYAASVHDLYSAGTRYKRPSLNKSAVAGFLKIGVEQSLDKINNVFDTALKNIVAEISK